MMAGPCDLTEAGRRWSRTGVWGCDPDAVSWVEGGRLNHPGALFESMPGHSFTCNLVSHSGPLVSRSGPDGGPGRSAD